jgi:epoxyqueuosine reductase
MNRSEIQSLIEEKLSADLRWGWVSLKEPFSLKHYDAWLAAGHHGEMHYLAEHRDLKANPQSYAPLAKSAFVFAFPYFPAKNQTALRTALYARSEPQGVDYHQSLPRRLSSLVEALRARFPQESFRVCVDSSPLMERDLAVRAGLGWIGKNTCVLDREGGSLFFIVEILASLEAPEAIARAELQVPKDFCGTCRRCIEICPTQALIEPRVLDARRCISYWTIESKSIAPKNLRDQFQGWFFGCDLCQTVCPWNEKVFGQEPMRSLTSPSLTGEDRQNLIGELRELLGLSKSQVNRRYRGTPLQRSGAWGLKRNALYVISNLQLHELTPEVQALSADSSLGELAQLASDVLRELASSI